MTKTLLTKARRWDENIGKLIVFAVTIIIAVGVLGTLAYFYNQSRDTASKMAVLTSINSSADDLKAVGVCDSSTGSVKYDARTGIYGIDCEGMTDDQKSVVTSVKGVTSVDCNKSAGVLSGVAEQCFYVNKSN